MKKQFTVLASNSIEDYRGYEIQQVNEHEYELIRNEDGKFIDTFLSISDAQHAVDEIIEDSNKSLSDMQIRSYQQDEYEAQLFSRRARKFWYDGPVHFHNTYKGNLKLETTATSIEKAISNLKYQSAVALNLKISNQNMNNIKIDEDKIKDENKLMKQLTTHTSVDSATYKKYNANNTGKSSPDCVKRAISMAFNIPYVKVGQDLNKLMHEKRRSAWNIPIVYEQYILDMGADRPYRPEGDITVAEFADENPSGTFILETSDKRGTKIKCGNHLTCVIDNVLYDSWDSSNEFVTAVYKCHNNRHVEFTDIQDHMKELSDHAIEVITRLAEKHMDKNKAFHEESVDELWFDIIKTTYKGYTMYVYCKFYIDNEEGVKVSTNFELAFVFTPETTVEEALSKITETAKIRMYDRFYSINKMWASKLEEHKAEMEMKAQGQDTDHVWLSDNREKRFFNSLPPSIKPRVTYLRIYWPGQYSYSYELRFKPLPGDHRSEPVDLEGYTADDIRTELDLYMNHGYQRIYNDYSSDEIF